MVIVASVAMLAALAAVDWVLIVPATPNTFPVSLIPVVSATVNPVPAMVMLPDAAAVTVQVPSAYVGMQSSTAVLC